MCLLYNNSIIWNSNEWLGIDCTDRVLMLLVANLYSNSDISEIPIYFAGTLIENNATGHVPFKLITVNLTSEIKMIIISDSSLKLSSVIECLSDQDDFFLQRIKSITPHYLMENELINTICISLLIINIETKSFKILIDETKLGLFNDIILNCSLSKKMLYLIPNFLSSNSQASKDKVKDGSEHLKAEDEFYIKGDNYIMYHLQIKNLFIFILFDSIVLHQQINEVKQILEGMKTSIEEIRND